ncbi:MAG: hypothetical protein IH626_16190, partial [Rhodospirillales bacterium]|nr:hypothetical protein [Rhodospirillales bacterium]
MVRRQPGKSSLVIAASLAVACGLAALAARGRDGGDLHELLPGIDPHAAALLARPDSRGFADWAAAANADRLIDLHTALLAALHAPGDRSSPQRAELAAALAAVDGALAAGCGLAAYGAESSLLAALPADSAAALVARYDAMQSVFEDTTLALERKSARLEELQSGLLAAGFARAAAEGWYDLALLAHRSGDAALRQRLNRSSLALARQHGFLPEQSRAWGQLMMAGMPRGWTAAERDTLAQLVEQARGARLAGTSTFLISLQAYDAFNLGRYGTARTLFALGIDVCRDLGDPDRALPTVDMLLRLYALLECWNQVDQLLVRAGQMDDATVGIRGTLAPNRGSRVRHATLAALSLAARGRADEAHAAFGRTFRAAVHLPFAEAEYLGQQWFTAMMENGRADLAADAMATVEAATGTGADGPLRLRLPLWRAWLELQRGQPDAAAAHLDTFAARAVGASPMLLANLAFQRDALRARALADASPDSAVAVLGSGWNRLLRHLHAREAGPEAYLDLARNTHLRAAAHELLGTDPEVGYGLELLWRSSFFPRWPLPADPAVPDLVTAARRLGRQACADLAARDAVHCLYRVERDRVVRWTASAAGVAQD